MKCFEFTRYLDFSITVLDKMRNFKKKLRKFAFEMYGANLSIDLHKRSRISADDTNQRNSELEILQLSAVDDPGDRRQEAARGSFQRPKL